jgi:hypothetical protein
MSNPATNQKTKRLVFTSVTQILHLVKNNAEVVRAIPKFAGLQDEPNRAMQSSCNCKKNITVIDSNKKQTVEQVLNSLETSDFLTIKNILQLDELCYYKRNATTKALDLICI